MEMMSITVHGRLIVDFIYSGIPAIPKLGEEVYSKNFTVQLGGGPIVTPIVLNNLGVKTKLGTFLGKGFQSKIATQLLNDLNYSDYVNLHKKKTDPVMITSAMSMSEDRAFVSYCDGMDSELAEENCSEEEVYKFLSGSKICFAVSSCPHIMQKLRDEGTFIVFDIGWNETNSVFAMKDILNSVDFYTPNDKEAMKATNTDSPEKALMVLTEYVKHPIVKIGAGGCITCINNEIIRVDMPSKFNAVEMTGAGDNFLAGVIYGLHNNMDIIDCMKMGNIFGGNSTTEVGCYKANMKLNRSIIDKYWNMYT
jgi:ribokinase